MIELKGLGLRMRAARKRAGLSLEAVGNECGDGVSPGAVAQWESETTWPSLPNFLSFCSATKTPPNDLLGWGDGKVAGQTERLQSLLARLGEADLEIAIQLISRLSPMTPAEKRFYKKAAKAK